MMPKNSKRQRKTKRDEPTVTSNINAETENSGDGYVKLCEKLIQVQDQLRQVQYEYDQFQINDTHKDSAIGDLHNSISLCTAELESLKVKYEELQNENNELRKLLSKEKDKFEKLESVYDNAIRETQNEIQRLQEENRNTTNLLEVKQAEFTLHLTDIKAQLENATSNEIQMNETIAILKAQVLEVENMLKTCETKAAIEKTEIIKRYEEEIAKKDKKLEKKKSRISTLQETITKLNTEKKELEKSTAVQHNKIQSVKNALSRPCDGISPNQEQKQYENQIVAHVQPTIAIEDDEADLLILDNVHRINNNDIPPSQTVTSRCQIEPDFIDVDDFPTTSNTNARISSQRSNNVYTQRQSTIPSKRSFEYTFSDSDDDGNDENTPLADLQMSRRMATNDEIWRELKSSNQASTLRANRVSIDQISDSSESSFPAYKPPNPVNVQQEEPDDNIFKKPKRIRKAFKI